MTDTTTSAIDPNWQTTYAALIETPKKAVEAVRPGQRVFVGTGCAQPQHLVSALAMHSSHIYDAHIIHLLTMGDAPYVDEKFRERFKMNSFFVADNVRHALDQGVGDYTPIFLSDIPRLFESGRCPIDVALISVTPPDASGLCSLGLSVDIVAAAAPGPHALPFLAALTIKSAALSSQARSRNSLSLTFCAH